MVVVICVCCVLKIRDAMAVRSWQKRLSNRLPILQKLALNNFGNQRHCFFSVGRLAHKILALKHCRRGVLVIYCQCNCFLWHCGISSFFSFFTRQDISLFHDTKAIYMSKDEKKNYYSWGKQTSGANLSHESVSPTQSTLRIFYVIDTIG